MLRDLKYPLIARYDTIYQADGSYLLNVTTQATAKERMELTKELCDLLNVKEVLKREIEDLYDEIDRDDLSNLQLGDMIYLFSVQKKVTAEKVLTITSLEEEFMIQNEVSNLLHNAGCRVFRQKK